MGYVAVSGGREAIEESLNLLEFERVRSEKSVDIETIKAAFPDLIDQVMGESSLYAPDLAALALKQAQGSPEEAVFLLRAFRSTLERPYVSRIISTDGMNVQRRISAAFKDIPGGQVLGATRDYSHRLLDFNLQWEDDDALHETLRRLRKGWKKKSAQTEALLQENGTDKGAEPETLLDELAAHTLPKVADYLRQEGILPHYPEDNTPPTDVTLEQLVFPTTRSARLQTLARGMTQAVTALGYAAIRGFGQSHPTTAELRYGYVDVVIDSIDQPDCPEDAYYVGALPVTEVESFFPTESKNDQGEKVMNFELGYGMVIGRAETKAIAMSVLDYGLQHGDKDFPTQDEEFVLFHVDGVEATGFISHLKLPHYVTFQSKLSSVRKTQKKQDQANEKQIQATEGGEAINGTDV